MFLQDAPADTLRYMLLGYGVILGVVGLFLVSLAARARNLRRDLELLREIQAQDSD